MFLVLYQPQYFTLQSHKLRVVSLCSFRKNSYPSLTSQYRILFRGKRSVPETFACSISCRLSTSYSRVAISWILVATLTCTLPLSVKFGNDWLCYAEGIERDLGKVGGGAASSGKTSTGVSRTVTRGVNLSGADFSGQDLSGISFQQSLLRETDFHGAKLVSASFFGAELSYANLEDADLTEANLELANLRNAKLKNAVLRRAYFSGNTRLENADIEGADFSEVILRKDQRKYLCAVAKGKNSHTGVETKKLYMPESPRCGFLSCGFPRYSRVTRRSDCLSFNTFGCRLIRRRLVKKGPVENLSWRPLVHQVAMSTTTAKTRYIESDFSVFRISPNEEELVSSFGDYFVEIATTSVQKQGSFTLAISGGSVLQCFSKAILETPNRRERVFWENTFIFLVDERYVPWDDPQSNYGQLRKALRESGIEHKVKVFPVNTSLSLEEAASSYEQDILSCESQSDFIKVLHQPVEYQVERVPAFDLILLGLGEDGHTASLFPNKELLGETKKLVGYERNSPKPPSERITLTYPALNYAKNVAFIVVGKGKAEIMRKLCEDHSVQYPARLVAPIFTRKDWYEVAMLSLLCGALDYFLNRFVDEDAMSKIGAAQDTPVQRL